MATIPIRDVPGDPVQPSGDELILIDNGIAMQKATINDAVTPKATEIADDKIADLNLGTASQADVEDFATAAQGELADTAVQPARTITAGDGLTGGGDLSADRTISLNSASIASLAKADTAVQSVVGGANVTVDATDPQNPIISVSGGGGAGTDFATVADLLADDNDKIGYAGSGADTEVLPGDIITAQGFRYEVAESDAEDAHVETEGGVKLYVVEKWGVDVRAFGASQDATASENTAAIQKAIDTCEWITINEFYDIDGQLVLNSTTRITGIGKEVSGINQTAQRNGFVIQADNCHLSDLKLVGPNTPSSPEYRGILCMGHANTVIERVSVTGFRYGGIRIGYTPDSPNGGIPSTNARVLNCDVRDVGEEHGIEVMRTVDTLVAGCYIDGVGEHGIRDTSNIRLRTRNNIIKNWGKNGSSTDGISVQGGGELFGVSYINDGSSHIGNVLVIDEDYTSSALTAIRFLTNVVGQDDIIDCLCASNSIIFKRPSADTTNLYGYRFMGNGNHNRIKIEGGVIKGGSRSIYFLTGGGERKKVDILGVTMEGFATSGIRIESDVVIDGSICNNIIRATAGTHAIDPVSGVGRETIRFRGNIVPHICVRSSNTLVVTTMRDIEIETGDRVRVKSTGTLPDGVNANTDYYAIRASDISIRLATSLANAVAGTGITLNSDGSGTIEIFPQQHS